MTEDRRKPIRLTDKGWKEIDSTQGETLTRATTKAPENRIKSANTGKPGWYNESYRHEMARRGIQTALKKDRNNAETKKPKPKTDKDGFSQTIEGEGYEPDPDRDDLLAAYISELDDLESDNNKSKGKVYESSGKFQMIDDDEWKRRNFIIVSAKNYLVQNGRNMNTSQITELFRSARSAVNSKNKELNFYWMIGKEVKYDKYGKIIPLKD